MTTTALLPVRRLFVAAILIAGAASAAAQDAVLAQESLKQLSIEQLGDVVVTSVSKEPEAVRETAAAISSSVGFSLIVARSTKPSK